MNKTKTTIYIIVGFIIVTLIILGIAWYLQKSEFPSKCGDGTCDVKEQANPNLCPQDCTSKSIPYYFIAIHNEPLHDAPDAKQRIAKNYLTLKEMIARANKYNIKLTLMFTAQWADYISESPERMADLELWKKQGHEIAAHHHSIYHPGSWDGYTDYSEEERRAQRIKLGKKPEKYLGNLNDFIGKLKKINVDVKSGCVNDEYDKRVMPYDIIYDTCSGFANYGEPGRKVMDFETPLKGKNEYISVGIVNNVKRKWLAHFQIITDERQKSAQTVFNSMKAGVYGAVVHSNKEQAEPYYDFIEFLHSKDPDGKKSRTVSEIIEQELIPERSISEESIPPLRPRTIPLTLATLTVP